MHTRQESAPHAGIVAAVSAFSAMTRVGTLTLENQSRSLKEDNPWVFAFALLLLYTLCPSLSLATHFEFDPRRCDHTRSAPRQLDGGSDVAVQ
jgi:hypothetical protein